ncbi:MAG: glucosamine-6-phosphate deaminase [Actinomycetaceae bacterium]|nr:glucosamine-6-phosphate deaminase [Arcanobacterium sp.]MDD7504571.1 glucosamine-6-phosphate deaminase [Actinomycetaceae bacterium]MDY6143214.1 glucosamine-6-phosphate deaminase [Arcanobacterium sp.]
MEIGIFPDAQALADFAGQYLIKVMNTTDHKVLGVATGSTPLPLYERMRQAHAKGEFSLDDAQAFALDEYVGIDPDHPERYRNVLRSELVGEENSGLRDENLHTPDANAADPHAAADQYDAEIKASGGITLQILGIGADGHIGFNEPGISLVSRTHVDSLTAQTREDNARFFDDDLAKVPTQCVTQGLGTIMDAREVLLIATGAGKADAVRELCEGGISAKWPATILQMHPKALVLVDEAAAAKLELADFYRERWEARGSEEEK